MRPRIFYHTGVVVILSPLRSATASMFTLPASSATSAPASTSATSEVASVVLDDPIGQVRVMQHCK